MNKNLTVKDLIKILETFKKDALINMWGGSGDEGGFATLQVCEDEDTKFFNDGVIILEWNEDCML